MVTGEIALVSKNATRTVFLSREAFLRISATTCQLCNLESVMNNSVCDFQMNTFIYLLARCHHFQQILSTFLCRCLSTWRGKHDVCTRHRWRPLQPTNIHHGSWELGLFLAQTIWTLENSATAHRPTCWNISTSLYPWSRGTAHHPRQAAQAPGSSFLQPAWLVGTHDAPPVYGEAESMLPAIHGQRNAGGSDLQALCFLC